jgi:hypothetical protein
MTYFKGRDRMIWSKNDFFVYEWSFKLAHNILWEDQSTAVSRRVWDNFAQIAAVFYIVACFRSKSERSLHTE